MPRYSLAVFVNGTFAYVLRFHTMADVGRIARLIASEPNGRRLELKLTIA